MLSPNAQARGSLRSLLPNAGTYIKSVCHFNNTCTVDFGRLTLKFFLYISSENMFSINHLLSYNLSACASEGFFPGGGALGYFSKTFLGGDKSGEICFFPLETKKTTFFAAFFQSRGAKVPLPPLTTPRRPCFSVSVF